MVARFGSIIPAPLAMPTMLPPPTVDAAHLRVEVGGHDALGGRQHRLAAAAPPRPRARASSIASTGSRQPMTPVERRQHLPGSSPSARADRRADPLRGLHAAGRAHVGDLVVHHHRAERGLLQPLAADDHRRAGKAFLVNIAAKAGVGSSSAISVRVIFAGLGTSTGMNSRRVRPTRKPRAARTGPRASSMGLGGREGQVRAGNGATSLRKESRLVPQSRA